MDVIGLHQYGIKNAIASSGCFTPEQRKILSYTNDIFVVFDGDEPVKSSWRAVENAFFAERMRMSFIFLKPGDDPIVL